MIALSVLKMIDSKPKQVYLNVLQILKEKHKNEKFSQDFLNWICSHFQTNCLIELDAKIIELRNNEKLTKQEYDNLYDILDLLRDNHISNMMAGHIVKQFNFITKVDEKKPNIKEKETIVVN